MRMILRFISNSKVLAFSLIITSFLKFVYYLTRPLFESGPDANGYIPAAIAFANLGLTSGEIPGMPVYPSGYPIFLSMLVKVSNEHWMILAQVCQVFLFLFGTLFMRKTFMRFLSLEVSNIASLMFALSPAWFVASGEAMYETLLFFLVATSFYFLTSREDLGSRSLKIFLGGIFASLSIVTHPRIVIAYLIAAPFIYRLHKDFKGRSKVLFLTLSGSVLIALFFAYLSFLRSGVFSLSTALWISMTFNDVFRGCNDFLCVAQHVIANPTSALRESLDNFYAFWSPHSGAWARGTWFHNISFLAAFRKSNLIALDLIFSTLTTAVVLIGYLLGAYRLRFFNSKLSGFLLLVVLQFIIADIFVYGDNRHRLIALPFMLPAFATLFTYFSSTTDFPRGSKR